MSTEIAKPKWDASNPRAIVHKKILDAARDRPDASIEELATIVKGASADLVERVLDEYGDPGNGSQEPSPSVSEAEPEPEPEVRTETEEADDSTADEPDEEADASTPERAMVDTTAVDYRPDDTPTRESLSEKQLTALRAIDDDPTASQRDLARQLGVTQSTINHRLNTIAGFDWSARTEFVRDMFESNDKNGTTGNESVETIAERLDELTKQVETMATRKQTSPVGSLTEDPDLICKVVRACIAAEGISEDEEDRIMKAFMSSC